MNTGIMSAGRPFSKKVFLFLVVLIVPASYVILPYSFTITSTTLGPGELPLILVLTLIDVAFITALAAAGLYLAARIGLGLPFVEGWLEKEPMWDRFRRVLIFSVAVGVIISVVIVALDIQVFGPPLEAELENLEISIPEGIRPPPWQGALASYSAGVTEEVMFRLFGVTLLAWLGSLVFRDSEGRPKPAVLWIAIILVAVLFGLAHLPLAISVGLPLTPLAITRTVVLNSIGGVVLGWLYWTRGLESAMVAHFSADIVLHVILVLVLQSL